MLQHWLIITFSWFGSVSLQYINTGGVGADVGFDTMDGPQFPIPHVNLPQTRNDYETLQNDPLNEQFYQRDDVLTELQRKRRTLDVKMDPKRWNPKSDPDKTIYIQNKDRNPYVIGIRGLLEDNVTANDLLDPMEKKYFSPWGGKRNFETMWTWKRANNIREPSMPKRVRFSPWGGKRSGQMVYKPGPKTSRVIFSTSSIPDFTKVVSNLSPNSNGFNIAGFQFIPSIDKRHPIQILALSTKDNDRTIRAALPFKTFLESLPKMFKPGHPYADVNLNKEGKRKVKFSAWGGKRSPPIIGPIWTPTTADLKDATLDTILLLRNRQDNMNKIIVDEHNKMSQAS